MGSISIVLVTVALVWTERVFAIRAGGLKKKGSVVMTQSWVWAIKV